MKLSAIDIEQQRFKRSWRGCDAGEVQRFLELVSQQWGEQDREMTEMRSELKRTQQDLTDLRDREEILKEAMLTAKRAIEDCRESAEKQSQLILAEAELRAEKLIAHAQVKSTELLEDISDLRRQRVRMIAELRGVINTHVRLLDVHEVENRDLQAPLNVLDSLRAPAPPVSDDADLLI